MRLAWKGDGLRYEYWLEEYDSMIKEWLHITLDSKDKETVDIALKLMSHIVLNQALKEEIKKSVDLDSEVYE